MRFFKYNRRNKLILAAVIILLAALVLAHYIYGSLTGNNDGRYNLSYISVKNINSFFKPAARKAVQDIVQATLDNTGYSRWEECRHQLDMLVEEADIIPHKGREVLVALSLPPQEGMIACYKRDGLGLEYMGRIPGLLPVTGITILNNACLDSRLIIADQNHDEMLGAFFNARYRDIFLWKDGHFDRVLGLLTGYNSYWNQAWDGIKEDAHWLWLNQSSQVEYSDNGETIYVRHTQSLLQSMVTDADSIPDNKDFAVRYYRMVKEEYRWSSHWEGYILGEYTDRVTGEKVALLEDYRTNIASFIRGTSFDMVKVARENGEILIIPAERLE